MEAGPKEYRVDGFSSPNQWRVIMQYKTDLHVSDFRVQTIIIIIIIQLPSLLGEAKTSKNVFGMKRDSPRDTFHLGHGTDEETSTRM